MITSNFPLASSSGSIPTGVIVMWSGATTAIPSGWALCNGQNGTPNLVDRFIVGAGSTYSVGATGGSASVTLTTAQMPSHNHSATVSVSGGDHKHRIHYNEQISGSGSTSKHKWLSPYGGDTVLRASDSGTTSNYIETNGYETGTGNYLDASHTHDATVTINNTGSSSSHENRPPYYALAYIMKL